MAIHFKKSSQFEIIRSKIEQHLFDTVNEIEKSEELALRSVENFSIAIEYLFDTLEVLYKNPDPHDIIGEKSFPIHNGRYRVFYKVSLIANNDFEITFIDIDDNRQSNLDRFPEHLMTFDDD